MSENKRFKPKKASIKRLTIAFILILAVGAGIYALLTKGEEQATEKDNIRVHSEEKPQTETKPSEDTDDTEVEKGTVTKEASNSTEDGQANEGTTNADDTTIKMPKYNKDAIIANAKARVYTVYTDLQQGSGFLINSKGDILTNAHVAKDAGFVVVKNEHGQEFQGKVIGISNKKDVAVVRVPDLVGKEPLVLDTATATVGTKIVAIGSPKDQYGTTTEGIIQSIGAEFVDDYTYSHLYEITAKLNKGSSGGPLINAETGNVIGINSIILEDHPEIGYAIPLMTIMDLVDKWTATTEEIIFDNGEGDFDNNHAEEAYFDEEFLTESMESFYELVRQSLVTGKQRYYESYIVENSEAMKNATALVDNYKANKKYKSLNAKVTSIVIGEETSTVNMTSVFTYIDLATSKQQTRTENLVYTIIIDEFGTYMISDMEVVSAVDTADEIVTPPVTTPTEPTPEEEEETTDPSTTPGIEPEVNENQEIPTAETNSTNPNTTEVQKLEKSEVDSSESTEE